jgi:ABC-type arginine transport system ATPase subunit
MRYSSPTADDFERLKRALGKTGNEMADLFGVAGGQQWRKYTSRSDPRQMSPQILFFGAARLALSEDELARVLDRMREIGADIDLAQE